jgi:hypothetical protein
VEDGVEILADGVLTVEYMGSSRTPQGVKVSEKGAVKLMKK